MASLVWRRFLMTCLLLAAKSAFAALLFTDMVYVPPWPAKDTVIQTNAHGYWVITGFPTGYQPPTGSFVSVQVFDEAGIKKFSFETGVVITAVPLSDPSPILDTARLPSVVGPNTVLTLESGNLWEVVAHVGGGGAQWSVNTNEPVLLYTAQGRKLMAFLTHGGSFEVAPFSATTVDDSVFVPPWPEIDTVIRTGSHGYRVITGFPTGYLPPTGAFVSAKLFAEASKSKISFASGVVIEVAPLPDAAFQLETSNLPAVIGKDTLLTVASGNVWKVVRHVGGGGAVWSAGTLEPVLLYKLQGTQLMAKLTHGGTYEVALFSPGQTNQTIRFGPAPILSAGETGIISATGGGSGNPVRLTTYTPSVCTIIANTVTSKTGGNCVIAGNQDGDAIHAPAIEAAISFDVSQIPQTITFGALADGTVGGSPIPLAATASSGLAVTFSSLTYGVCNVLGVNATLIGTGTCTIAANQIGSSTYAPAPTVTRSFAVGKGQQIIGPIASFPEVPAFFSGGTFAVMASASSALPVIFGSLTPQVCSVTASSVTMNTMGMCTITANQPGNANYFAAAQVAQGFYLGDGGSMPIVVVTTTGPGTITSIPAGIACGTQCSKGFAYGTVVTLTAVANAMYAGGTFTFLGWTGACSGSASTCRVPMDTGKSVVATFSYAGGGTAYAHDYVQKAYVAYYGRPADPEGQGYWAVRMDQEGGSLSAIIAAFGNSNEFNSRYGGLTNTQLVTRIYQQTLGRDPEQGGLDYYVGELKSGNRTLQSITLDVLNGAVTPPDSTVVANRLDVAAYYTAKVAAGCVYGTEQDGVNALSGVTASPATVTTAKAAINTRCGD